MMKKINMEELKMVSGGAVLGWPNGWDCPRGDKRSEHVGKLGWWDRSKENPKGEPVGWPNGWD